MSASENFWTQRGEGIGAHSMMSRKGIAKEIASMGVGVYSSDFNETGGTFLVDGSLGTEEDYQAYEEDQQADGEEPQDYDTWRELEVEQEVDTLNECVQDACRKVGFGLSRTEEYGGEDQAFRVLARGNGFSVGVRGWEHDHVVGVWQDDTDYGDNRDAGATEIAKAYLDNPATVLKVRDQLSKDLQEYVRLHVQEQFTCYFKTSGYTAEAYPDLSQDDLDARLAELEASIKKSIAYLDLPASERVKQWDLDDFKVMVEHFHEEGYWTPILVPVYDVAEDGLVWISADESLDERINERALYNVRQIPAGVERPVVEGGAQLVPFPMSDALLEACRVETIAREGVYRAGMCAPAEIWQDITGNALDLVIGPDEDDAQFEPSPSF